MSSFSRQQLETFVKQIEVVNSRVLDIGGSQLPIKDRVKKWENNDYVIADIVKPHEVKARADMILDLNKDFDPLDSKPYDVIFCLEVMEYVYDPVNAFDIIKKLLNPGGIAYISFHFVYPVHNPKEEDCLRYTEFGVRKLCEKVGLVPTDWYARNAKVGEIEAFYAQEQMRPARDYNGHEMMGFMVKIQKPACMTRLNIGAGRIQMTGFTNIDITQFVDGKGAKIVDIVMDVEKEKLPFEDNSVEEIRIDSVLEHIGDLKFVLNECHRVLKEGGEMSGCVPEAGTELDYQDPTHKRRFIVKTFSYFTGMNPAMPSKPSHPRYADYGYMPWIEVNIREEEELIFFTLTPRKV